MRGPGKLHNRELALAFELKAAGVQLEYIAEGLGCSVRGLTQALERAVERGPYPKKRRKVRHINVINGIAYNELKERGHI